MMCNDLCQHGVYKRNDLEGKPEVVYGNGCVYDCHNCEKQCPVGAISYFGDDERQNTEYDFDSYKPEILCEGKPKVAFVCVHNSCRSQIAECLGKMLASDTFDSYSAGTELKDHINQDAVRLMKEIYRVDMEETQYNKLISAIPVPDVVIFMGCNVSCPNVPFQYAENWKLDDPSGKSDAAFRAVIETIEKNILKLKEKLMK